MLFGLMPAGSSAASSAVRPAALPQAAAAPHAAERRRQQTTVRPAGASAAVRRRRPSVARRALQLANLYFDAERYSDAIDVVRGGAEARSARNADVSTDLASSYYYLNQPDRALSSSSTRWRSIRSTPRRC